MLREKPVDDHFKQREQIDTKKTALDLLKTLGTRDTLPVLEEMKRDSNPSIRQGVEAAIAAIETLYPEEKTKVEGKDKKKADD